MIHQGYWRETSKGKKHEVKPRIVIPTEYQQLIEKIPNYCNYIQTIEELPENTEKFKIQFDIGGGGAEFGYDLTVTCDEFVIAWDDEEQRTYEHKKTTNKN